MQYELFIICAFKYFNWLRFDKAVKLAGTKLCGTVYRWISHVGKLKKKCDRIVVESKYFHHGLFLAL